MVTCLAKSYISPELPDKFLAKHQLMLYFNDLLVDLLVKADEKDLSSEKIDLKDNETIPEDISPIDWLIENGYKDVAFKSTKSHVYFSLLRDFMFYMHESFSCSERGKVTVAFANSRKPIKDNLFYMCWLLVDSKEFISKLLYDEPRSFEVSTIGPDFIIHILKESVKKVDFPLTGELLAEIIYDKKSPKSLAGIWDKSLHVVTNDKRYPTPVGTLNFIFADDEIWDEYWETYYNKISHIMNFAVKVSIALFEEIAKVDEDTKLLNKFIRNMKYDLTYSNKFESEFYKDIFKHLSFTCEECNGTFKLEEHVLHEFIYDYLFTCPYCEYVERVGQYYFGE